MFFFIDFITKPTCVFQNRQSFITKSAFLHKNWLYSNWQMTYFRKLQYLHKTTFAPKLHLWYKIDTWFTAAHSNINRKTTFAQKVNLCYKTDKWFTAASLNICRKTTSEPKVHVCYKTDLLQEAKIIAKNTSAQILNFWQKTDKWLTTES